jgi:hypothetical protein
MMWLSLARRSRNRVFPEQEECLGLHVVQPRNRLRQKKIKKFTLPLGCSIPQTNSVIALETGFYEQLKDGYRVRGKDEMRVFPPEKSLKFHLVHWQATTHVRFPALRLSIFEGTKYY